MKVKELMKALENKSTFRLAWAVLWRMWVLILGFYIVCAIVFGVLAILVAIM